MDSIPGEVHSNLYGFPGYGTELLSTPVASELRRHFFPVCEGGVDRDSTVRVRSVSRTARWCVAHFLVGCPAPQ